MPGWQGQALEIDLATGRCKTLTLPPRILHSTIGGRGLAGYLLNRTLSDPDQPLFCLATGPLCGSPVETANRLVAVFRSPLTCGVFAESSGCDFALALKQCGYDALLVKGVAAHLSHLRIDKKGVQLTSALHPADKSPLQDVNRETRRPTLEIGLAGENRVRYASVVSSSGESLERGGLGCLFGQMKLKRITAPSVQEEKPQASAALAGAQADLQRLYNASPFLRGPLGISVYGTAALFDLVQARRMLPIDNFRGGVFDNHQTSNAGTLKRREGHAPDPCPGCSLACRKRDAGGCLPEYDSLTHFRVLCRLSKIDDVLLAVRHCRQLGLDPVSTAVCLAAYAEIKQTHLDGALVGELLDRIAAREGEGARLAEGSLRYLEGDHREELMRCTKGLELPAFDLRGAWGMALSLAVSPAGDYRQAQMHHIELLRKPVPVERFSFAGKARILVQSENLVAVCDSLSLCRHTVIAAGFEEMAAVLSAATGYLYQAADLAHSGARTLLRERRLNQQFGWDISQDDLPQCFFSKASGVRPLSGLNRQAFEAERARYYHLRGLDAQGRFPLPKRDPDA